VCHRRSLHVSAGVVVALATVADPQHRGHGEPDGRPCPYPANVMDAPDFSPLEVETSFVDPIGTDIRSTLPDIARPGSSTSMAFAW